MQGKTIMEDDDEEARTARAENLMAEIERLTSQSNKKEPDAGTKDDSQKGSNQSPESPREFIHRRMRELDKQEKRKSKEERKDT